MYLTGNLWIKVLALIPIFSLGGFGAYQLTHPTPEPIGSSTIAFYCLALGLLLFFLFYMVAYRINEKGYTVILGLVFPGGIEKAIWRSKEHDWKNCHVHCFPFWTPIFLNINRIGMFSFFPDVSRFSPRRFAEVSKLILTYGMDSHIEEKDYHALKKIVMKKFPDFKIPDGWSRFEVESKK